MWALLEDKWVGHRPASTRCHHGLPWQVAAGPGYCGVSSPPLNIGVRHLNKVLIFLGHTFRPITRRGFKSDVPRLLGCFFFFFLQTTIVFLLRPSCPHDTVSEMGHGNIFYYLEKPT